jgi:hypothetical protein
MRRVRSRPLIFHLHSLTNNNQPSFLSPFVLLIRNSPSVIIKMATLTARPTNPETTRLQPWVEK